MFEKEIQEYEDIRKEYQEKIADRMGKKEWMEYIPQRIWLLATRSLEITML